MPGLGTLVNIAAVIVGASIGLLIKGGLKDRFKQAVMAAIGLSTMMIGVSGALKEMLTISKEGLLDTQYVMLVVLCLVAGALLGEWIDIEKRLDGLGLKIESRLHKRKKPAADGETAVDKPAEKSTFVEGFVTSSLLFCVGAMAIVGAMEDGLNLDPTTLYAKSVMDGVSAVLFAASLGIGVYFSCFSLLLYQGGITLLAGLIRPYLTDVIISQMSLVGSVLILAIGLNLIFGKKIKVGNLLPAVVLPIVLYYGQQLLALVFG